MSRARQRDRIRHSGKETRHRFAPGRILANKSRLLRSIIDGLISPRAGSFVNRRSTSGQARPRRPCAPFRRCRDEWYSSARRPACPTGSSSNWMPRLKRSDAARRTARSRGGDFGADAVAGENNQIHWGASRSLGRGEHSPQFLGQEKGPPCGAALSIFACQPLAYSAAGSAGAAAASGGSRGFRRVLLTLFQDQRRAWWPPRAARSSSGCRPGSDGQQ